MAADSCCSQSGKDSESWRDEGAVAVLHSDSTWESVVASLQVCEGFRTTVCSGATGLVSDDFNTSCAWSA